MPQQAQKFIMTGNGMLPRGPEVQLGFEDGSDQFHDESHMSTPRKVIREIIVQQRQGHVTSSDQSRVHTGNGIFEGRSSFIQIDQM